MSGAFEFGKRKGQVVYPGGVLAIVSVAEPGSFEECDRAFGIVGENGVDTQVGIFPPLVFLIGDPREDEDAGALQAAGFGPVDLVMAQHDAGGVMLAQHREIVARLAAARRAGRCGCAD